MTQWQWVERYARQFEACDVRPGDLTVVLSERTSRPEVVETAKLALASLGTDVVAIDLATPSNAGPLPIRSTGASQAIADNPAAIAALGAADFIADCTVEGLLHAPELEAILESGARVLMVSNEHPENCERWPLDEGLARRVEHGLGLLRVASTMRVTSAAGTDLSVNLDGAFTAGSHGYTTEPGSIAHWPGGLVLAFPAAGCVSGRLVLAPGDVNLTFKQYLRDTIECTVVGDYIVSIEGTGVDVDLFRSYLDAFDEPDAFAVSHVGWGMNPHARWEAMSLWDRADINGTELRSFAGNFLYSTGANRTAGRFGRAHFDLPMRGCTVALDGQVVVAAGKLRDDLAGAAESSG